jgi:hypothetical protein
MGSGSWTCGEWEADRFQVPGSVLSSTSGHDRRVNDAHAVTAPLDVLYVIDGDPVVDTRAS